MAEGPPESYTESIEIEDVDEGGGRFRKEDPPMPRGDPKLVRSWLAYFLLGLIGVISLTLIGGVLFCNTPLDAAKDLATAFVSPLLSVFGAVVGFYFGGTASHR